MNIEFKCIKCGKKQLKNKEKSNENWESYDCKDKCNCGGSFGMFINNELIGGGEK